MDRAYAIWSTCEYGVSDRHGKCVGCKTRCVKRVIKLIVNVAFGTKKGLVVWDEYDPVLLRALAERLRVDPLADAIREAIVRPLDRVYAAEASRILRRVRLVHDRPGLRAAVASSLRGLRLEMAPHLRLIRRLSGPARSRRDCRRHNDGA